MMTHVAMKLKKGGALLALLSYSEKILGSFSMQFTCNPVAHLSSLQVPWQNTEACCNLEIIISNNFVLFFFHVTATLVCLPCCSYNVTTSKKFKVQQYFCNSLHLVSHHLEYKWEFREPQQCLPWWTLKCLLSAVKRRQKTVHGINTAEKNHTYTCVSKFNPLYAPSTLYSVKSFTRKKC